MIDRRGATRRCLGRIEGLKVVHQVIGPRTAGDRIGPHPVRVVAGDVDDTAVTFQKIIASLPVETIVAGPPLELVSTASAEKLVVAADERRPVARQISVEQVVPRSSFLLLRRRPRRRRESLGALRPRSNRCRHLPIPSR